MVERSEYDIGQRLGELIVAVIQIIADLDGVSYDEVVEQLFSGWWEKKIIEGSP